MTKDKNEKAKTKHEKFAEGFMKPNPNRDPNAAFITTGFRGHPSRAAAKRAEEAEKEKDDDKK